jgi:DNA-binding NarL/FixJ family response regulator
MARMMTNVESATQAAGLSAGAEKRVRVAVWASDAITLTGLTETLMGRVEVFIATDKLSEEVDVHVFATDRMTTDVLATMRRAAAESTAPMVLVTSDLDRSHVLRVIECRVVAVLHRRTATEAELVGSINVAAQGGGVLPPNLLGDMLREVQNLQRDVLAPRGLDSAGLTPREIDVVRLIAEGWDTGEIGKKLCYSERTVKNIIYGMTSRLNLRNRPQLVAYSVRAGII